MKRKYCYGQVLPHPNTVAILEPTQTPVSFITVCNFRTNVQLYIGKDFVKTIWTPMPVKLPNLVWFQLERLWHKTVSELGIWHMRRASLQCLARERLSERNFTDIVPPNLTGCCNSVFSSSSSFPEPNQEQLGLMPPNTYLSPSLLHYVTSH